MADFRSNSEKLIDAEQQQKQQQTKQEIIAEVMAQITPEIERNKREIGVLSDRITDAYNEFCAHQEKIEVAERVTKAALKAITLVMTRVETETKNELVKLFEELAKVHRKIQAVAEDDLRLVQQLNENQQQRIAELSKLAAKS